MKTSENTQSSVEHLEVCLLGIGKTGSTADSKESQFSLKTVHWIKLVYPSPNCFTKLKVHLASLLMYDIQYLIKITRHKQQDQRGGNPRN